MLLDVLNLEGVTPLTKGQQGEISGGQNCIITIDGVSFIAGGYSEGSAGSSEANDDCVGAIMAGAGRCSYDCAYDGFGQ